MTSNLIHFPLNICQAGLISMNKGFHGLNIDNASKKPSKCKESGKHINQYFMRKDGLFKDTCKCLMSSRVNPQLFLPDIFEKYCFA